MKSLLCLLLTLCFIQHPKSTPDIETDYDRFTDTTSVKLLIRVGAIGVVDLGEGSVYIPPGSNAGTLRLFITGTIKGKDVDRQKPVVTVSFISHSRSWRYLRGPHALRLLIDGKERIFVGEMERRASEVLHDGYVVEQLALVDVPFALMAKIAAAKDVEVQIGIDEMRLTSTQLEDIKQWVARFPVANAKR